MIPENSEVVRAFALDARRHMGIKGHYPEALALPDRWISWWPGGVSTGLRLIARHHPRAIWSTYPVATAHLIAYALQRRTGLPWIADFRDPVIADGEPVRGLTLRSRAQVERLAIRHAQACVFVTPGMRALYARRYAHTHHGEFEVIQNGFDEEAFSGLRPIPRHDAQRPFVLVHSGGLYPAGRNPEPFFKALADIFLSGRLERSKVQVVLRASGAETLYAPLLRRYGLEDVVVLAPLIDYCEALKEQLAADALLLFQGREFNPQIPAKVYEYFRVGKPILTLADQAGETAKLIGALGVGQVIPIDNSEAIARCLPDFIMDARRGRFKPLEGQQLEQYSRRAGALQLRGLIDHLAPRK